MSEALHLIAQANTNEDDAVYNGKPGDQKGFELNARQWYSYPWDYVYRAVDESHREKIADFMEKAITNGYIGYDTNRNKRDTLFTNMVDNGFKVDVLVTPCYADCSSLTFCAIYSATGVDYVQTDELSILCPRTDQYATYIEETCAGMFEKLTGTDYTASSTNLIRGDILISVSGSTDHTAVWI